MAIDRPESAATAPAAAEKQRLLQRWVRRRLGSVDHERRVAEIADTLFALTRSRHDLTADHRRMLAMGAMVHDVGRADEEPRHEIAGAKLILKDKTLPLTPAERRGLAYLTRYHRGPVPDAGDDGVLTAADDHAGLRLTLALLRVADAFNSRSLESPHLVFALRGRTLWVTCYLDRDSAKARKVYRRRKKLGLLEELIHCRIEVDVRVAEALSMVA